MTAQETRMMVVDLLVWLQSKGHIQESFTRADLALLEQDFFDEGGYE